MSPTDPLRVRLAGSYRDSVKIDGAIKALRPLMLCRERTPFRLDLSDLSFAGPSVLGLLKATVAHLVESGCVPEGQGTIVLPRAESVREYSSRMDTFAGLLVDEPAERFRRRQPLGFRPIQRFSAADDYPTAAQSLTDAMAEKCSMTESGKGAIRVILDEVTENVVHHADAERGGFAVAQSWSKLNRMEIVVLDLGIGIRKSFEKSPEGEPPAITSDADAIVHALGARVTSSPWRNAGIGLHITEQLLRANGGEMFVASGRGRVVRGARQDAWVSTEELPGTMVSLAVRLDRPLDLAPIYAGLGGE